MQKKNSSKKTIIITVLITLVVIGVIIAGFQLWIRRNKSNETANLNDSSEQEVRPINTVDYGPPKPEDSVTVPDKLITPENEQNTSSTDLGVVITSVRKSSDGVSLLIKGAISGSTWATCRATMTSGDRSVAATSTAEMIEGQYSCKDLKVALSQLTASSKWNLQLTAVTDGGEVSSTQEVIL